MPSAHALTQVDVIGPSGSELFGYNVVVLTNGNYVVADTQFDNGATTDVGAVYLYNGQTNALISTLTGSKPNDNVGQGGTVPLANGNFVVVSPNWDNGAVSNAGAATLVNGTTGLNGTILPTNSLVGSRAGDFVGSFGAIELTNGNYVVASPSWSDSSATLVGAATWGNGSTGVIGPITSSNSLIGSTSNYAVGIGVEALANGNYVVTSPRWDSGASVDAGAVTWGNGTTGTTGTVTTSNSLTGLAANSRVGSEGATALTNGNYVALSPEWTNGVIANLGAATWGNGATGTTGAVSSANSLIGSSASDFVSSGGVTALSNGNYVVASAEWDNGSTLDAGAATWGNGTNGTTGAVSTTNSIHGSSPADAVAGNGVTPLTNGNYVIASPEWAANAGAPLAGAATWATGTAPTAGPVSAANSVIGSVVEDRVGDEVVPLTNGNYVVISSDWSNGAAFYVGAVTWGNGTNGTTGAVSAANSLIGSTLEDQVGSRGVTPLTNGNYVVASFRWDNGAISNAGAVTWASGTTGRTGTVTTANSLVGSQTDDLVGVDGVIALANGNYVVGSGDWANGAVTDAGAATWGNGTTGIAGAVSTSNSLVGTNAEDFVSNDGITAFDDGSYAVASARWTRGTPATVDDGAVTYGPPTGIVGTINATNSAIGTPPGEILEVATRFSADNSIVITTEQNRVILLRVPFIRPVYRSLTPGRLVDTRPGGTTIDGQLAGIGQRAAGSTLTVPVAGRAGVGNSATTATLNIVAVGPTAPGFLTVYPCDSPRPNASTLNYNQDNIANAAVMKLSATGTVCIYTDQATQLIVDVTGFHPANTTYTPLKPLRLVDTRVGGSTVDGQLAGGGQRSAGSTMTVQVAGRADIDASAKTAMLNIVAVGPTAPGFLTVYPCDATKPNASTLNYNRNDIANAAVMKLSAAGTVCIYTDQPTQLIVDAGGYHFNEQGYTPLTPARLADTRVGGSTIDGVGAGGGQRTAGSTLTVQVTGRGGVAPGTSTAMLNIVAVGPTAPGFLTVYPCDAAQPNASTLNYNQTDIANAAVMRLSATGTICIYTDKPTQLIVDVNGFYQY